MALSNIASWKKGSKSSACGTGEKASACGSACGSSGKPEEKASACGSACGASGDK